jgi:hypothetical protein
MEVCTGVCLSEIVPVPKLRCEHSSHPPQKVSFLPVVPEGGGRSSLRGIMGILAWDDGQCPEFQS